MIEAFILRGRAVAKWVRRTSRPRDWSQKAWCGVPTFP